MARRNATGLELVATLRHSVLDRRYVVSLFTFKEKTPEPMLRLHHAALLRSPALPPSRISLLSPSQISRRAHGGLLLKVLAAWRERWS